MGCCTSNGNKVEPVDAKPKPTMEEIYQKELVSKRHNCTDIICIIIFIVLCLIQIGISILIFVKGGDPATILLPHDSQGNACRGSTPYLFYFNLIECANIASAITSCPSPTQCVAKCPDENLFYLIESQRTTLLTYCNQAKLKARFSGTTPTSVSASAYYTLADDDICPSYALNSKPFYSRCLPTIVSSVVDGVSNSQTATNSSGAKFSITDLSGNSVTDKAISKGAAYIVKLMNLKSVYQTVIEDLNNASYLIGTLLAISAVTTFVYILIMRWILAPMVYFSMIAVVLALAFVIYYCIDKYLNLKSNTTWSWTTDINTYFSLGVTWLVIGIIAGIILLIVLLLIIALIKRIRTAIAIICESSKAVTGVFITLFFPILPLLTEAAVLIYFIATTVYLSTAGTAVFKLANSTNSSTSCVPSDSTYQCYFYKYGWDSASSVDKVMQWLSDNQWFPHLYNLFMFYWIESFIVGFNQMVLAGSFGIWFWSQSRSSCIFFKSFKDTTVYHLGTLAFGSLLIAIVKVIRFLISQVEKRLKNAAGNNPLTKCCIKFVACCCKCFFWCLEKFLKFISKNAYIMCAIYGRNFCASAIDALSLLMENPLRAAVLDSVSSFVLFVGRLLITACVGVLAFFFFSKGLYVAPEYSKYFAPDLHYYWVPLLIVIFGTYFIAVTFFSVFEMAIDTIFLCALKDMSIHDGSLEKPYFMSTKLLKIMDKKNSAEVEANEALARKGSPKISKKAD